MSGQWARPLRDLPSYIPLFPDSYMRGARHLKLEEHGAHLQLMMHAWDDPDCALPDDDERLAIILGISTRRWLKLRPAVFSLWHMEAGVWKQRRLTAERNKIQARRVQAKTAANLRWNPPSR